jgi:hypothetical protein
MDKKSIACNILISVGLILSGAGLYLVYGPGVALCGVGIVILALGVWGTVR